MQERDEMVLTTQLWLNVTYLGVANGYVAVPEDGRTGWLTIYGLIMGLQWELGISPVTSTFGPTTTTYYNQQVTPIWGPSIPANIVYLIQGAFWCKGISPGYFNGQYSSLLDDAVNLLKTRAGFQNLNSVLDGQWAKALFDMMAFSLVPGGDSNIRTMQQWLNSNYISYTGIMPCDGVYQRDTNKALIYALQAELGFSPEEANGTYGPGTTAATYPISQGDSGNYVKVVQYGLYVNGFYRNNPFNGYFSSSMGNEVLSFRQFMILPAYTSIADVTVIKGLLTSAGDTNRKADGVDTSTQLTALQVQTLTNYNVKYVGRYLTGTVGGVRDKYLTVDEIYRIFSVGIRIFPIYQDGGASLNYFNYDQGFSDGQKAYNAAYALGIPVGTYIYFAVDIDVQGGDIPGTVIRHFEGIHDSILGLGYNIGVYGTRNVCSQVITRGLAKLAFVSNMSTGYSGNLGFPMPKDWSFDQFIEWTMGSGEGAVGIDQVAVSGRDYGFSSINSNQEGSDASILSYVSLNQTQLQVLKEEKIQVIIRSLNSSGSIEGLSINEIKTLVIDNGFSVALVYVGLKSNTRIFDEQQGLIDGLSSLLNLVTLGIFFPSIVYYEIDEDTPETELQSNVIPYFRGLKRVLDGTGYRTGIKSSYLICHELIYANVASYAFVNDRIGDNLDLFGPPLDSRWSFHKTNKTITGFPITFQDVSGKDLGFNEYFGDSERDILKNMIRFFIANSSFADATQEGNDSFLSIFDKVGFKRDGAGVYHTKIDAPQIVFGYNRLYDFAFDLATSMDVKEFDFIVDNDAYRFWTWRGDYLNLGAGAELGIYKKQIDVGDATHWVVDPINLTFPMSMILEFTDGRQIAEYNPVEKQWWCTSFNPYYRGVNKEQLSAKFRVDFTGKEQFLIELINALQNTDENEDKLKYWDFSGYDPSNNSYIAVLNFHDY